jgi:hypothetical protein
MWLTIRLLLLTWLSVRLRWLLTIWLLLIIELNVNMDVLYALKGWHYFVILIYEILFNVYTTADVVPKIIDIGYGDRSIPVLSLHGGDINVLPIRIHCPLLPVTPHQLFYVASEASKPIHARIVVIPILLRILLLLPLCRWWLLLWGLLCLLLFLLLLLRV